MSVKLLVEGMNCASCAAKVEKAALSVPGVTEAKVNLTNRSLSLEASPAADLEAIAQAVTQAGYPARPPKALTRASFAISNMNCAGCQSKVEKATATLAGVASFSVNLMTKRLNLDYDPALLAPEQIQETLAQAGYPLTPAGTQNLEERLIPGFEKELQELSNKVKLSFLFALPLLYLAMGPMVGLPSPLTATSAPVLYGWAQLALLLPLLWIGRDFYRLGFPQLFRGSPTMDSLIAVGTLAATLFSLYHLVLVMGGDAHSAHQFYFETAGVILALILFGRLMEATAKQKSFGAITELLALQPNSARLLREGEELTLPTLEVIAGDRILVKAGEVIPTDGVVLKGQGEVNESMITGESALVAKTKGSEVIGGCVLAQGLLEIEATRIGADSTLAKMIRLVEQAQASKAPIAKLADQVAAVFVPVVMGIALAAALIWLALGAEWVFAIKIFVAVLVIACPCALGLATPTAILVGTSRGAKLGILIKGGESLERLARVQAIVFDKTGTLTQGKPVLAGFHNQPDQPEKEFFQIAAALEMGSEHSLAEPILAGARSRGITPEPADDITILPGQGILGHWRGQVCRLGSESLMKEAKVFQATPAAALEEMRLGHTLVYLARDTKLLGWFSLRDTPRPEARAAIAGLKSLRLTPYMLTGDKRETALEIAQELRIEQVIAEVKPEEKLATIQALQAQGLKVAMVGDGINDAPALTQADVGIALGSGTQVSMESADMVLLEDNLEAVTQGIRLSRATLSNIKQNLFWAFGYNVLGIPLAAGLFYPVFGLTLNPMIAALAMAFSSVSVVGNALRLARFR